MELVDSYKIEFLTYKKFNFFTQEMDFFTRKLIFRTQEIEVYRLLKE